MGAREQAKRLEAGAADIADALKAIAGAAKRVEELNAPLRSDALRGVVASLHTEYGRLSDVGDRVRDVANHLELPAESGALVPCRLVALSGAPIMTMDLPPPRIGELIQLGTNHPWLVTRVKHLREHSEYAAVVTVELLASARPRKQTQLNEEECEP